MTDEELKDIFTKNKVIASVGLSSTPGRASNRVCAYLKARGYVIIPVNPNEAEVIGEKSYPDLASVPVKVDLVQIFRRPEAVPAVVEDAIKIGAKVVWMQDGAGNPTAAARAEQAGLVAVVDDCMMREHARLFGN
jgi:predicted CoA-binding protein